MSRAILIVGLPGSGKTTLARRLLEQEPSLRLFDDVTKEGLLPEIEAALRQGDDVIVIDPHLCLSKSRDNATRILQEAGACTLEWHFFANDPAACRSNVRRRDDGRSANRLIADIDLFTRLYTIPEGIIPRPVYPGAA